MILVLTLITTAHVALGSSEGHVDPKDGKPCDWQCYLDRYGDLAKAFGAHNVAAAKLHWETNGEAEGRHCACYPPDAKLCDWQCYLDQNGDLAKAFGPHNVAAAKLHWETNGEAEGRDCACYPPAQENCYIGCFVDDDDQDFEKVFGDVNSVEMCRTECAGYKFFAVQHGDQCFCGNYYSNGSQYKRVEDSQCQREGFGEGRGGSMRNSVYTVNCSSPPAPGESEAPYAKGAANACPAGYVHIESFEECKRAAEILGAKAGSGRTWTGSHGRIPPFCSYQSRGDDAVHFNTDAKGKNDGGYTPICKLKPAVDKNLHKSVPFTLDMTVLAQRVYDAEIKTGDIVPIPMTGNKYKVTQTIADPGKYGKIWFAEFEAGKVCSLVTRGSDDNKTLLLDNLDWATVTIPQTEYKVMKGYQSHILAILEHDDNWNKMRNWLASCTARGFTKLFTGHSLGGSVSVWLAIYFEEQQSTYHADYIATFGQPRLVQTFGSKKCPLSLQSRTRAVRIVNADPDKCDAAALVPGSNDPNEASCFESFSLDNHGNLLPKDDQWPNWSYGFAFNVIGWGLHSMAHQYVPRMEKVKAKIDASEPCLEEGTHCDKNGDYWGKGSCDKKCCHGSEYNWARLRHECIAEERPCIKAGGRCEVQGALNPKFKYPCASCCNRNYAYNWLLLRHECK